MNNNYNNLKKELHNLANQNKALLKLNFFQTKKGQYGEGDQFLGIAVPEIRKIAKKYYKNLTLNEIRNLLSSPFNEERYLALIILIQQYNRLHEGKVIYDFYLKNIHQVNNWNLVDLSASPIVGTYLVNKDRSQLNQWAISQNLWLRRIAIVATWKFIKQEDYKDTLRIAQILLKDNEDLIHKAVGWMLREVGKKNESVLKLFLKSHLNKIPRTTLRYAIERLDLNTRKSFLFPNLTFNPK